MTKPENPPAFPHPEPRDPSFSTVAGGMSLRDWFAGQALAGLLPSISSIRRNDQYQTGEEAVAAQAFALADTMLTEREKHQ